MKAWIVVLATIFLGSNLLPGEAFAGELLEPMDRCLKETDDLGALPGFKRLGKGIYSIKDNRTGDVVIYTPHTRTELSIEGRSSMHGPERGGIAKTMADQIFDYMFKKRTTFDSLNASDQAEYLNACHAFAVASGHQRLRNLFSTFPVKNPSLLSLTLRSDRERISNSTVGGGEEGTALSEVTALSDSGKN